MLTKTQIANRKKWVKALRSGKYKQGSHWLYNDKTDTYCCLGVAEEVCGVKRSEDGMVKAESFGRTFGFRKDEAFDLRWSFAEANDEHGMTFGEIADVIDLMTLADK